MSAVKPRSLRRLFVATLSALTVLLGAGPLAVRAGEPPRSARPGWAPGADEHNETLVRDQV